MSEVKVWRVDEANYVAARTAEQAFRVACQYDEGFRGDELESGECVPEPLSDERMQGLTFYDDLHQKDLGSRTFAEELKRRLEEGESAPFYFAIDGNCV